MKQLCFSDFQKQASVWQDWSTADDFSCSWNIDFWALESLPHVKLSLESLVLINNHKSQKFLKEFALHCMWVWCCKVKCCWYFHCFAPLLTLLYYNMFYYMFVNSTPPEVQHRVGNGWCSVLKGLNDYGETFRQREEEVQQMSNNIKKKPVISSSSINTAETTQKTSPNTEVQCFSTLTVCADKGGEVGDESNSWEVCDVCNLQSS